MKKYLEKNISRLVFVSLLGASLIFSGCKEEELSQKIDPTLLAALKSFDANSQRDQIISIVFKVNEPLTELHHSVLSRMKVKIIANIGPICTANLPAEKVVDLAKMKFVEYIQGSREFKTTPTDSSKSLPNLKEHKQ